MSRTKLQYDSRKTFMDVWLDEMFPIVEDDCEMEAELITEFASLFGEDIK